MSQPGEIGNDDESKRTMYPMNRCQRLERQIITSCRLTQMTPQGEAVLEVHLRDHIAMTEREVLAGQRRIIGAHPAAQSDLYRQ